RAHPFDRLAEISLFLQRTGQIIEQRGVPGKEFECGTIDRDPGIQITTLDQGLAEIEVSKSVARIESEGRAKSGRSRGKLPLVLSNISENVVRGGEVWLEPDRRFTSGGSSVKFPQVVEDGREIRKIVRAPRIECDRPLHQIIRLPEIAGLIRD